MENKDLLAEFAEFIKSKNRPTPEEFKDITPVPVNEKLLEEWKNK